MHMKLIGLTGNIATGKSTIARYLASQGATIYPVQETIKRVFDLQEVKQALIKLCTKSIIYKDRVDTSLLSDLIRRQPVLLNQVADIIGPYTKTMVETELKALISTNKVVIIEADILFKGDVFEQLPFDHILNLELSKNEQVQRLAARNSSPIPFAKFAIDTEYKAMADNNFAPETSKRSKTLDTSGTIRTLVENINTWLKEIGLLELCPKPRKAAVFAGSFDPLTLGHLHILQKSTEVFDEVTLLVLNNKKKDGLLLHETRMDLCKQAIAESPMKDKVKVCTYDGLLVDYLALNNITHIIRGLRTSEDFIYEQRNRVINQDLSPSVETIYFMTDSKYAHISSSAVRELYHYNIYDMKAYVPKAIYDHLVMLKLILC